MLGIALSLSQLAKMLCLSYYCLFLLFKGTGEKLRTGSAWKRGWWWRQEGEMTQTMYAPVNKWIIFKKKKKMGVIARNPPSRSFMIECNFPKPFMKGTQRWAANNPQAGWRVSLWLLTGRVERHRSHWQNSWEFLDLEKSCCTWNLAVCFL
jgi:hypothetical protein